MLTTCSPTRVLILSLPRKLLLAQGFSPPEDKHGLQKIQGMTIYLTKFILDYSDVTAPLRELLWQDVDWCWLEPHAAAFSKLKEPMQ